MCCFVKTFDLIKGLVGLVCSFAWFVLFHTIGLMKDPFFLKDFWEVLVNGRLT